MDLTEEMAHLYHAGGVRGCSTIAQTASVTAPRSLPPRIRWILPGSKEPTAHAAAAGLVALAVLAVLNSVISLYYYMRIMRAMFFEKGPEGGSLGLARMHVVLIVLLAVPTIVWGLAWGPIKAFADRGMMLLG